MPKKTKQIKPSAQDSSYYPANKVVDFFSWKAVVPLIFIAFLIARLAYNLWKINESDLDEEVVALPTNCSDFALISGSLKNASIILIGENHDFKQLTLQCVAALTSLLPVFNTKYDVYLEGRSSDFYTKNTAGDPLCKGLRRCLSWDDPLAHEKSSKMMGASAFVDVTYVLLEAKRECKYDDQALSEVVVDPDYERRVLNHFYSVHGPSMYPFYQSAYEQIKQIMLSYPGASLADIAINNFKMMKENFALPQNILTGTLRDICIAIYKALSPEGSAFSTLTKTRDKKLASHIAATKYPSIFIAGYAHVDEMKKMLPDTSVAMLKMNK